MSEQEKPMQDEVRGAVLDLTARRERQEPEAEPRAPTPEEHAAVVFGKAIEWLWRLGVGKRFVELFQRQAVDSSLVPDEVVSWVSRAHEGASLLLMGPTGSGKTVAAIYGAFRLWYTDRARWNRTIFVSAHDAYRRVFERDTGWFQKAADTELLVIDDWGAAYEHDWPMSEMDYLVDLRWRRVLPTLVTTNLHPYDGGRAFSKLYPRAFSRLVETEGIVQLNREDLRRR